MIGDFWPSYLPRLSKPTAEPPRKGTGERNVLIYDMGGDATAVEPGQEVGVEEVNMGFFHK